MSFNPCPGPGQAPRTCQSWPGPRRHPKPHPLDPASVPGSASGSRGELNGQAAASNGQEQGRLVSAILSKPAKPFFDAVRRPVTASKNKDAVTHPPQCQEFFHTLQPAGHMRPFGSSQQCVRPKAQSEKALRSNLRKLFPVTGYLQILGRPHPFGRACFIYFAIRMKP